METCVVSGDSGVCRLARTVSEERSSKFVQPVPEVCSALRSLLTKFVVGQPCIPTEGHSLPALTTHPPCRHVPTDAALRTRYVKERLSASCNHCGRRCWAGHMRCGRRSTTRQRPLQSTTRAGRGRAQRLRAAGGGGALGYDCLDLRSCSYSALRERVWASSSAITFMRTTRACGGHAYAEATRLVQ